MVSSIDTDVRGTVWVFVEGVGICRYDSVPGCVRPVHRSIRQAACLRADGTGRLWLGAPEGVYRFDITSGSTQFYSLPHSVTSLHLNRDGRVWASTDGGGVYMIDKNDRHLEHLDGEHGEDAFTSKAIKGVWEDRDGRIWVATLRGGINIIDRRRHLFRTSKPRGLIKDSYDNIFISSFCETRSGNLWIGTDGHGVSYWDRAGDKFSHYRKEDGNGLKSNNITGLLLDHEDRIWVAAWGGGVRRYDPHSGTFEYFPTTDTLNNAINEHAWKLYEDRAYNLWLSTYGKGGLYRLNRKKHRFELFDGNIGNVLTMSEDGRGRLWAGTDDQLIRLDTSRRKHLRFDIGCRVRSILDAGNDYLWVATEGGGLLRFHINTQTYKRYTEIEGLPGNAVFNILPGPANELWLSTLADYPGSIQ